MKQFKALVILTFASLVQAQLDGGFWWLNKNTREVSDSRSLKEQSAKIRTLPPRYRKEPEVKATTVRNSIFDNEDEEDRKMFKYDNEPDCVCTPKHLCNENNTIITDGSGVIDERSVQLSSGFLLAKFYFLVKFFIFSRVSSSRTWISDDLK